MKFSFYPLETGRLWSAVVAYRCGVLVASGALERASAQGQPTFLPQQDPRPGGQQWVAVPELSDEFNGAELDLTKWQSDPKAKG